MTDFALAELQAVLRAACRGVGAPAALGDELAEAAAFAPGDFAHWQELHAVFKEPVVTTPDQMRCLIDGPSIVDRCLVAEAPVVLAGVDAPNIFGLYLRRASQSFGVSLPMEPLSDGTWKVTRFDNPVPVERSSGRVNLPEGLYPFLSSLAARTHVPATEETRLSGAGAGLNDND